MKNIITEELIENAFTYDEYKKLISELITEGKTTGINQSESNVFFTKLNAERIKRIEKTIQINEDLKKEISKINEPIVLLVIAESWCGDVAQNLPPLKLMADINPNIELKIILRDENPLVMDEFLTNGTRSIPVCLIIKKRTMEVLGKWGPRPKTAQEMMKEFKTRADYNHDEADKKIQIWYAKDRTNSLQEEFGKLFRAITSD